MIDNVNMELRPYMFASPDSTPQHIGGDEIPRTPEAPQTTLRDLLEMDGDQLFNYIRFDVAKAEEEMYGSTDVEAKLIFLGGTRTRYISEVKTVEGESIYKTQPEFSKISETEEYLGVANQVIHEGGDIAEFMSEAADLFYNYTRLYELEAKSKHKGAPDYIHIMSQIAGSLGWDKKQALLLAGFKYHRRLVEAKEKDPKGEKKLMEALLADPFSSEQISHVSTPTFRQIDDSRKIVEDAKMNILEMRYAQIVAEKKLWLNGKVHEPWA